MVRRDDYGGREQAYVKHYVLEHYLQQLALKVGRFQPGTTLNYIDGFSGPWQHATEDLRDTSPHVALTKLLTAKRDLEAAGTPFQVRGFFVEKDATAHGRLRELLGSFEGAYAEAHVGEFEAHLEAARRFAGGGPKPFAFIFIDPTGWTGYPLAAITPLLRVRPCEVLINFMTKDISRFIDDKSSNARHSFVELFGDAEPLEAWRELEGTDREDKIVETYCDRLRRAGGFDFTGATIILNPQHDRTHYHLVYATRSLHGLIAFRETERRAMSEQIAARAEARQQRRVDGGQQELFAAPVMETPYMEQLRERYQARACGVVEEAIRARGRVDFDDLITLALAYPMTSLADLKGWLDELRAAGRIDVVGLGHGQRALKVRSGHAVVWRR
ncbi:MAG: three-Cys-motif partner protein TcmP [Nannocystaceae bacterium]